MRRNCLAAQERPGQIYIEDASPLFFADLEEWVTRPNTGGVDQDVYLMRCGKYVLEQMIANDAVLGGEQSGHVIDLVHHTTGDGILTAISIFSLIRRSGKKFSELETFEPAPQVLVNTKVPAKPPLEELERYQKASARYEEELDGNGRILVRYSGTENLVRVMFEGNDQSRIEEIANDLSEILKSEIEEKK